MRNITFLWFFTSLYFVVAVTLSYSTDLGNILTYPCVPLAELFAKATMSSNFDTFLFFLIWPAMALNGLFWGCLILGLCRLILKRK